jgi:hypothetical protein
MADKVCPPVKAGNVPNGIGMPESHSTLSTPNPTFGKYFGAGTPGSNAVNSEKIM